MLGESKEEENRKREYQDNLRAAEELCFMSFMPRLDISKTPFDMSFPSWMSSSARKMIQDALHNCHSLPAAYMNMGVITDVSLKDWPIPRSGSARGRVPADWMVKEDLS